jgi:hypothetical protein
MWGRREGHSGGPAIRKATLLACGALLLGGLASGRFLLYLCPLLAFAAAVHAPPGLPARLRWRFPLELLGLAFALQLTLGIRETWRTADLNVGAPRSFQLLADAVRAQVPPGALLVTEDSILSGVLWSFLPGYRYLGAYDSAFLYAAHPKLFWRWAHLRLEGIDCDEEHCPHAPASAQAISDVVHAFGSEYLVSFYLHPGFSILPTLYQHPERFQLLAAVPAYRGKMTLWRVLPDPADKPWAPAPAVVPLETR